mgnify:CR=1 FL=1
MLNAGYSTTSRRCVGAMLAKFEKFPCIFPAYQGNRSEYTFVCQRAALAVGCLAGHEKLEVKNQESKTITHVRKWFESSTDSNNQVAGLIALALFQDESSFQQILGAAQGSQTRPILQKFLKDLPSTAQGRFFAFLSLDPQLFWRDQDEKTGNHYIQLLQSSREARDRIRAIQALNTLGEKSATPAIESAFAKDPSPQVRAVALAALGRILQGEPLVAKITQAAQDPSDSVRSQVLPMINHLSLKELQGAREHLIPLLDSTQEGIREPVAELLARLYHRDWHILADQLLGTEKQSRILGLIETLSRTDDAKMAPLFVQFMKHNESKVRSAAAFAAAHSGILPKKKWIPYLEDPLKSIRLAAIRGLGKHLDSEVLEIFAVHLEDPSTQIRREMAILLGKRKLAGNERPKEILQLLSRDENLEVRLVSFVSLFRLGVTGLAKEVESIIPNFEKKERDAVLEYLKKEGIFVELVGKCQHAPQVAARKEAIELLAVLDLSNYVNEISPSLQDPASDVRLAAIEALGQIEEPEIQRAIGALAQDPVEAVRTAVKRRNLRTVK